MPAKRIRLNAFDMAVTGHLAPGVWTHPDDQAHRYKDLEYWTELAKLLERGKFDGLFLADVLGVYDVYRDSRDPAVGTGTQVPVNDPLLSVSAMAAVTKHLGFGVTVSLTYEQPYALARKFTTLDHLTKGRVAWNIVTSYLDSAAVNLGLDQQITHDNRYDIGEEFLEVTYKLWESSWEDDAVIADKSTGRYADPDKVHPIEHKGEYYSVPGVFLAEPSPQRTPVLYQAGTSTKGRSFAAKHAEAVFIMGHSTDVVGRNVADVRRQAAEFGRDPESVKFFALVTPIVAETDEAAQEKFRDYLGRASYEGALTLFGGWTGIDLSGYSPTEILEHVHSEAIQSVVENFSKADPTRTWTPEEIGKFLGIGGLGPVIVGSPATVADELERWIEEADVDGFNVAYATTPGTFADFIDLVVPELRRRGLVWEDYEGDTLRESIYEPGQVRLRDDHPGARYRRV
ncbi:LLM class flavin-dependent oxidoreductase [Amycolatopsis sp. lyj-90]|uniref:LLM class flavin-dependent oxidoreductase n=1 Tax=Amycolatopsis sp. lyj-90 TaxID=2789285 RepID=UPI00397A91C2